MALTVDQLEGMRDALLSAIGSGALRVQFADRSVQYGTPSELRAALTIIEKQIEAGGGGPKRPTQIVITPRGL
jgi:hypothetical protein